MSEHKIHNLERDFESFKANIGANEEGHETAYLYGGESTFYLGYVTYDKSLSEYTFTPENWPLKEFTHQDLRDIQSVINWMKARYEWQHSPIDEHPFPRPNTEVQRCINPEGGEK